MKKFLQLFSLLCLVSCVSGNAPTMDRKIKIYNGAPEEIGICRLSTATLADKLNTYPYFLKQFHKGTTSYECIGAAEDRFKQYSCMSFEDLGVLYKYIETLIYQCKKW